MDDAHHDTSRLTSRYQTTVPASVRRRLKLQKGDSIGYHIDADGRVFIAPVERNPADPALGPFLALLAADIATHPERISPLPQSLIDRMRDLVGDVTVDLDAALPADDI
jgi:antitoxin PrlF